MLLVDGAGLVDGVLGDCVNPAQGDGQIKEAVEHLLGPAQGRMADEGGGEDELAEPVLGDGQVEEDFYFGGAGGRRVEGVKQSGLGFVPLLVDELAADGVIVGKTGDPAALVKRIQGEVDALLGGHGVRGAGGRRGRVGYNGHGLASGSSRSV